MQQLIKSVNRKGYDKYRCKDSPINSVCQSGLCRTKRFGVGFGEEEMPVLGSLTKYASKPPEWFLSVDKKRMEIRAKNRIKFSFNLHIEVTFSISKKSRSLSKQQQQKITTI